MSEETKDTSKKRKEILTWNYWWKEWILPLLLALVLAFFIRAFFIQAFKIPTGSMRSTLLEGDRILVDKTGMSGFFELRIPFTEISIFSFPIPTFREPKRGDIVVFRYPVDHKRDFVKRLIAFGGETVSIKNGRVYINDVLLEEPERLNRFYYYNRPDWPYGQAGQNILVPQNHFFVLGDNSRESSDSRNWGFVPRDHLIGRALCIYWPLKRLGGIEH